MQPSNLVASEKKSHEILLEELKAQGINEAEEVIVAVYQAFNKAAPRIAVEATDSVGKAVGGVLMVALPAFKTLVEKFADLNKDGKIGDDN